MTQFLFILLLFLLAFSGLAAGLLLKRRGLRSGCGHAPNEAHDCRCESDLDQHLRGQNRCAAERCQESES